MKKKLRLIPISLLLFGVSHAVLSSDSAPSAYPDKALEHFNLLNIYRSNHDVGQLEWNANLAKCAEDYLYQQIYNNFQGHYGQDGRSTPTARCKWAKMGPVGENLIASTNNFPSPEKALELWDSSTLHKKNMLMTGYGYVGVAAVWDPVKKQARRAQVFAFKKTTPLSTNTGYDSVIDINETIINIDINNQNYYSGSSNGQPILVNWNINQVDNHASNNEDLLKIEIFLDYKINWSNSENTSREIMTSLANIFGTSSTDGSINNLKYRDVNIGEATIKKDGDDSLLRIPLILYYNVSTSNPSTEANNIINILDENFGYTEIKYDSDFLEIYNTINDNTSTGNELQSAITWMYNSGLTMYNTIDKFLPNNTMSREEASKFFSVFAKTIFNKSEDPSNTCSFKDIDKADSTLQESINSACRLGIFKGYNRYFSPFDKLTNAQAITVLMRIMVGQMKEPTGAFYSNYVAKAKEYGLIDSINLNQNITRGEAAILLYKAVHR